MKNRIFKQYFDKLPKEIKLQYICTQNLKYHPEKWVYTHTKTVFSNVIDKFGLDVDMLIVALFHDIAKKQARKVFFKNSKLKINHINHEIKAERFFKYLDLFSCKDIDRIKSVITNHMKAHLYLDGSLKKQHKRQQFESLPYFDDIIKFAKCDHLKN